MRKRSWCSTLKIRFARALGRKSGGDGSVRFSEYEFHNMNWRELAQQFEQRFDQRPRIFRAPGAVNLIGEHTDYNDGFVMPAAIGFFTWAAVSPRTDRTLSVFSENFSEPVEFDLDSPAPRATHHWSDYVRGVAEALAEAGFALPGANLVLNG